MPPVIEGAVNSFAGSILETEKNVAVDDSKQEVISLEESKVPSEEDLAFPEPFSKLVPLDELSKEESSSLDLNIEPEDSFNLDTENLAKEVEEDVSVDEFWAIDGGDQSALHMETDQPVDIEEITFEAQSDEKPADAPQISTNPTSAEAIDQKELVEALKQALTPVVEQFVKEYCSKKIEQVAWEVIPDLAENLIRSEIKEISQTIKSQ